MSTPILERDLRSFAVELFEHCGGIAEWPDEAATGAVVLPRDIARGAALPGEEFSLAATPAPGALPVGLGGEFLDVAARVLELAVPRDGAFRIPERYLTRRDLSEKLAQTFAWQNARAKYDFAEPAVGEYHIWTIHAQIRSEDTWEALFRIEMNAETQALLNLPDIFQEPDLAAAASDSPPVTPSTYATMNAEAQRRVISHSTDFMRRIDQRLERDRKRLNDYYRALAKEADGSARRRAATPLSPQEVADKKRAVELELRRKLAELTERYAMQVAIRPVALARVQLPVLVVPVTIQRKRAFRRYPVYWNSLLKRFEPLSCSHCRRATFSPTFADDTVDLYCSACSANI